MARKMIVKLGQGAEHILEEKRVALELELQELVKEHPDLLPIEEFELAGPLLVVGRETPLPSGAIDLAVLATGGEILLVEFKTGPSNPDFRCVLAQLVDYGSDLWGMTVPEFEQAIAVRYFASAHCRDPKLQNLKALTDAVSVTWPLASTSAIEQFYVKLAESLKSGNFHYLVVAQRFTETVERTVAYLNATSSGPRFYAIELVGFEGEGVSAFETRGLVQPDRRASTRSPTLTTNQSAFLAAFGEEDHRTAIEDLLELAHGLGLRAEWGSLGVSLRVRTPDRPEPISAIWLYPPGKRGWMDLTDVTLGYDPASAKQTPSVRSALDRHVEAASLVPGAIPLKTAGLRGWTFTVSAVAAQYPRIREIIAELAKDVSNTA